VRRRLAVGGWKVARARAGHHQAEVRARGLLGVDHAHDLALEDDGDPIGQRMDLVRSSLMSRIAAPSARRSRSC
jgi:hypothetical protein